MGELRLIEQDAAAHDLVDPLLVNLQFPQCIGKFVLVPPRNEIGRRALKQRDMLTFFGNRGHHRRRRGA